MTNREESWRFCSRSIRTSLWTSTSKSLPIPSASTFRSTCPLDMASHSRSVEVVVVVELHEADDDDRSYDRSRGARAAAANPRLVRGSFFRFCLPFRSTSRFRRRIPAIRHLASRSRVRGSMANNSRVCVVVSMRYGANKKASPWSSRGSTGSRTALSSTSTSRTETPSPKPTTTTTSTSVTTTTSWCYQIPAWRTPEQFQPWETSREICFPCWSTTTRRKRKSSTTHLTCATSASATSQAKVIQQQLTNNHTHKQAFISLLTRHFLTLPLHTLSISTRVPQTTLWSLLLYRLLQGILRGGSSFHSCFAIVLSSQGNDDDDNDDYNNYRCTSMKDRWWTWTACTLDVKNNCHSLTYNNLSHLRCTIVTNGCCSPKSVSFLFYSFAELFRRVAH